MLLGVSVSASEGAHEVQSVFEFCNNVVCMLFERSSSVEWDSMIFVLCATGRGMLSVNFTCGCVLYSALRDAMSEDLFVEIFILLLVNHSSNVLI